MKERLVMVRMNYVWKKDCHYYDEWLSYDKCFNKSLKYRIYKSDNCELFATRFEFSTTGSSFRETQMNKKTRLTMNWVQIIFTTKYKLSKEWRNGLILQCFIHLPTCLEDYSFGLLYTCPMGGEYTTRGKFPQMTGWYFKERGLEKILTRNPKIDYVIS